VPSASSALSTQSAALREMKDSGPKTQDLASPRLHPLPQLPPKSLEPLELSSTRDLDSARSRFFSYSLGLVQTPSHTPRPHPGFAPGIITARVLSAIQLATRDSSSFITIFNHSGIEDRSLHSFDCFCESLRAAIPKAFKSRDLIPLSHKQTGDHSFRAELAVTLPGASDRLILSLNLHRPTTGPLARCWLVKLPPDTS
jgi:hypothetical protein